ncbi:MAG TPA: RidA family protein, partial [Cyclobacteriaceae bacterium]|nr:RidA family protein [Cyclobacteriaceae bacterium]
VVGAVIDRCSWDGVRRLPMSVRSGAERGPFPAKFSQATIAGNLVFVSGQAGIDFETGKIDADFGKQARHAFENLKRVLEASGSDLAHTTKVVVWLKRPEDFETLNALYQEYFPETPPARSVPVVDLPKPEYLISVEAIAILK